MNLEQKLEAVQNQLNEIKSELEANKRKQEQEERKKRNWAEMVEVGMLFSHKCGDYYIAMSATGMHPANTLVSLSSGCTFSLHNLFNNSEKQFTYIGLAKDLIKIEDAAPPTYRGGAGGEGVPVFGRWEELDRDVTSPLGARPKQNYCGRKPGTWSHLYVPEGLGK